MKPRQHVTKPEYATQDRNSLVNLKQKTYKRTNHIPNLVDSRVCQRNERVCRVFPVNVDCFTTDLFTVS